MSTKTNKSFTKRLRVTKTGKIKTGRGAGGNHFNAKESRKKQLARKVPGDFAMSKKTQKRFIPYN